MLALLASFLVNPAAAASHEVSAEVGWIGAHDPAWNYFSNADALGSYGLRLGFALHPNVAVVAGWQHAANGAFVSAPTIGSGSADAEYYDDYGTGFRAAMFTDQLSVGAKADFKAHKYVYPYVTAQLLGMRGLVRMDDDPDDDENITQLQAVGLTGGVMGAAGVDIPVPVKVDGKIAVAPYLELGYSWYAPMVVGQLGSVQFAGFSGRAGIGVRF